MERDRQLSKSDLNINLQHECPNREIFYCVKAVLFHDFKLSDES